MQIPRNTELNWSKIHNRQAFVAYVGALRFEIYASDDPNVYSVMVFDDPNAFGKHLKRSKKFRDLDQSAWDYAYQKMLAMLHDLGLDNSRPYV